MPQVKHTPTYSAILKKCEKLGITISDVTRGSGVSRDFLEKLKGREPKTIQLINKVNAYLDKVQRKQEKEIASK